MPNETTEDKADLSADRAYINGYRQAFLDWITDAGYLALQRSLETVEARIKNAR